MHTLASLYYHCTYFHGATPFLGGTPLASAALLAAVPGGLGLMYAERRRRRRGTQR